MRIGVCVSRNDFFYDIHALVKSFYPEDEVKIYAEGDPEADMSGFGLVIPVEVPPYTDRKAAKDRIKRELYHRLSSATGTALPWGMLSGIRPTKIPMAYLQAGETEEACIRVLTEENLVSPEKAALATEIAAREIRLLRGIPLTEKTYSLYIHIPFCPTICAYCTFSSNPYAVWKKMGNEYLTTLLRELRLRHRQYMEEGYDPHPTTVYIGGGTPTTLSAGELDALLTGIREIWDLRGSREFTVEAGRPDSITDEKLRVLLKHGVTRISVNPQTMDDRSLARIGRSHTAEDTVRAFRMVREAGFTNINMDMIIGLPGEGTEEVSHTLAAIRELKPESLTVHSLALKRASAFRTRIIEDRLKDVDADRGAFRGLAYGDAAEQMRLASACAKEMGMEPYYLYRQKNMRGNLENTGFAVPGCACLYNILIMEELQSILAFGAGASTKYVYPDGRIERTVSPKDIGTYIGKMQQLYPTQPEGINGTDR